MDALLQALPPELLTKIMLYTLESRHKDLELGYLKYLIDPEKAQLLMKQKKLVVRNGHITKLNCRGKITPRHLIDLSYLLSFPKLQEFHFINTTIVGNIDILKSLEHLTAFSLWHIEGVHGDIANLSTKLQYFDLGYTNVMGDIKHLHSLIHLTSFDLRGTNVTGDIKHLKSLSNLILLDLYNTGVEGDISHLQSLTKLQDVCIYNTRVKGDINTLKNHPRLNHLGLSGTDVTGDIHAFADYRWNHFLKKCYVSISHVYSS